MIQIDQQIWLYTDTYLITYTNQSSEDRSKYKRVAQTLLPYVSTTKVKYLPIKIINKFLLLHLQQICYRPCRPSYSYP